MTENLPTEPVEASKAGTLLALGWTAVFLITMGLFVAYCWWRAHPGMT